MNENEHPIGFGDNVKVRTTPVTEEKGLAGLLGQVYGETTPSITEVEVIGTLSEDYAINVHIEARDDAFWFSRDQLEFVDYGPGTEIVVNNIKSVRRDDGRWEESVIKTAKRRWWK